MTKYRKYRLYIVILSKKKKKFSYFKILTRHMH